MGLIFRLGIAGVAAYVFMPVLRDIAAVDPMPNVVSAAQNAQSLRAEAQQLLAAARQDIAAGDLDKAYLKVGQVRGMNLTFGALDDRPARSCCMERNPGKGCNAGSRRKA